VFDVTTGQELFKLTAADAPAGFQFGLDVDISGNIVVVGAPSQFNSHAGAAYLFDLTTGQRLHKLRASDASTDDNFGGSVAIEGNIAIIGAPFFSNDARHPSGYAYVFDVTTGQQLFKLVPSDGVNGAGFGESVDISGNMAIVGAGNGFEAAYLFDVTTGQELLKLTAPEPAPDDRFGRTVAIDGNRAIVGASPRPFTGRPGAAYVFDVTRLPGDFSNDGAVDGADFLVWQRGLGATYTQAELADWRANFGTTAARAAAVAGSISAHDSGSIPEPTGAVLAALAFVMLPAGARKSLLQSSPSLDQFQYPRSGGRSSC
jgi:outer membrane protein assembly factor BamB